MQSIATQGKPMNTSLIQFGSEIQAVTTVNAKSKSTSVRLLRKSEFRELPEHAGEKGQELRRAYNAYIRQAGQANTASLSAEMTSGRLLVKGFSDYRSSLTVRFVKASSIVDKEPKSSINETVRSMSAQEREELIALLTSLPAPVKVEQVAA
jgi:hypothetical protein